MIILVSDHHVEVVLHQGYSELTGNFLQLSILLCSCLGAIRVVHSSSAQCYRAELCPRQRLLHLEHVEDNPDGRMHVEAKLAHQIARLALVVTSVFSIKTWSYLFQRLKANLAFLLGPSGFLAFFYPDQLDSK